jgi:hypothetical protein
MKNTSVLLTILAITLTAGLVHAQTRFSPGGPPPPAAGATPIRTTSCMFRAFGDDNKTTRYGPKMPVLLKENS